LRWSPADGAFRSTANTRIGFTRSGRVQRVGEVPPGRLLASRFAAKRAVKRVEVNRAWRRHAGGTPAALSRGKGA